VSCQSVAYGGVFGSGDAPFDGSAGALGITNAVGVAEPALPTLQAYLGVPALRGLKEAWPTNR
jgi:hypothetical protein